MDEDDNRIGSPAKYVLKRDADIIDKLGYMGWFMGPDSRRPTVESHFKRLADGTALGLGKAGE
jgi:hypothetical protein